MPLSALAVTRAKPGSKPYKLTDGHGMYLLMTPAGGRYWRLNYRFDGKARTMALGVFPDVTLADARSKRDDARKILAEGEDPTAKQADIGQIIACGDLAHGLGPDQIVQLAAA